MTENATSIKWPSDLYPKNSPVHTHNELEIKARSDVVWAWLICATRWPEWYSNSKDVQIIEGKSATDLSEGSVFTWKTFGMRVKTWVEVFEPFEQLAWRGTGLLGEGYHIWIIKATNNGCLVITEEVQRGFLISLGRWRIKQMLLKQHQYWLEGLARVSQQGLPEK